MKKQNYRKNTKKKMRREGKKKTKKGKNQEKIK